jgi:hypothetical protein
VWGVVLGGGVSPATVGDAIGGGAGCRARVVVGNGVWMRLGRGWLGLAMEVVAQRWLLWLGYIRRCVDFGFGFGFGFGHRFGSR